jgi:hypothetical protein
VCATQLFIKHPTNALNLVVKVLKAIPKGLEGDGCGSGHDEQLVKVDSIKTDTERKKRGVGQVLLDQIKERKNPLG